MSYVDICRDFVKNHGYITHKHILNLTTTNCSYSVMRALKKIFLFEEVEQKSKTTGKPYTLYLLRGQI